MRLHALDASQIFMGKHLTSPALCQVLSMARRTYQLQNTGLEVFFPGRSSLYLTLKTHAAREDLRSCLQAQPGLRMRQQRSLHMWRRDWILGKVCHSCCSCSCARGSHCSQPLSGKRTLDCCGPCSWCSCMRLVALTMVHDVPERSDVMLHALRLCGGFTGQQI